MRRIFLGTCFLLALLAVHTRAATPTPNLAPELRDIFKTLTGTEPGSLVGKEFTATVTLKYASKTLLVFSDAFIEQSPGHEYQIARWEFAPELADGLVGSKDIKVSVRFRIESLHTEDPKMPYFAAKVLSLTRLPE